MSTHIRLVTALLIAACWTSPVVAKKKQPPAPPAAPVIPHVATGDAAIDAYYYYDLKGQPLWLSSPAGREAAAKVVEILKGGPADGLPQGPVLAAQVSQALVTASLTDDAMISAAWVKYVRALEDRVPGVEYGDPALAIAPRTAKEILDQLRTAPVKLVHVDEVSRVNPFYAALRSAAVAENRLGDPHVEATLDRLRLLPDDGKMILVDTAAQRLLMVDDGQVVNQMKVIVGKDKSPTYNIAGKIHYVTLNPYWNIPMDVVRRRVAPLVVKRGTSYLKAARYVATSRWGVGAELVDPDTIDWKAVAAGTKDAYLRQMPGPNNMMGKMKFGFVNSADIFLHDTPKKKLFDHANRNLSMGCVRLERAPELARWLMDSEPTPGDDDAPEQQVQLGEGGVPVYTLFLTAYVDDKGKIALHDDAYHVDTAWVDPASLTAAAASQPAATPVVDDGSDDTGGN